MSDSHPDHRLSLESIEDASRVIDPLFLQSPQFEIDSLSEDLGCRVVFKDETRNPIGSFKGRGADYFVGKLVQRGDDRPLVCASTGNFGQAMAYACRNRGRSVVVYADLAANRLKTARIAELGAEVRLFGDDFDAAKLEAKRWAAENRAFMVEDGAEPEISEGAGSLAVELARNVTLDHLVVPVGNGALIGGVARWFKAVSPETRVVGVSATGADAMERSWRSGRLVEQEAVDTIAEGIAVRVPVPSAVDDMRDLVDEMLLVNDDAMLEAMRRVHDAVGIVAEPAAVAGVAALIAHSEQFTGSIVGTILTGGNVTDEQRRMWLG